MLAHDVISRNKRPLQKIEKNLYNQESTFDILKFSLLVRPEDINKQKKYTCFLITLV